MKRQPSEVRTGGHHAAAMRASGQGRRRRAGTQRRGRGGRGREGALPVREDSICSCHRAARSWWCTKGRWGGAPCLWGINAERGALPVREVSIFPLCTTMTLQLDGSCFSQGLGGNLRGLGAARGCKLGAWAAHDHDGCSHGDGEVQKGLRAVTSAASPPRAQRSGAQAHKHTSSKRKCWKVCHGSVGPLCLKYGAIWRTGSEKW